MTWSKNKNSTANISTVIIHSVNYLPSLWPTVNLGKHPKLIWFPDLSLTKPSRNEITLQSTDYAPINVNPVGGGGVGGSAGKGRGFDA